VVKGGVIMAADSAKSTPAGEERWRLVYGLATLRLMEGEL
jgi:hypothetical protein